MKGINLGASPEPLLPPQAAGYQTRKGIKKHNQKLGNNDLSDLPFTALCELPWYPARSGALFAKSAFFAPKYG